MSAREDEVRAFVARTVLPRAEAWDHADDLPDEVIRGIVALGVTGALVPREYGGGLVQRRAAARARAAAPALVAGY